MTSWFITKNGRLFTRTIVGVAAAGVFGVQLAFHGPLLNTYQSLVQMYSYGIPKPLPSQVLQTADLVLNDCGLKEEKKKIKFFSVIGRDLFHAGCTSFPWGAMVGLPFFFGMKDKRSIDLLTLKIHGREDVDWFSEGDELLQSFVLSENAQKFAIAREVFACSMSDVFTNPILSACAILIPARVVLKTNSSRNAFKFPFGKRAVFYILLYGASFISCKCFKDFNNHIVEKDCDQKAASLGPEYLEGGIEFYEQILSKNKALRKLMGPDGERYFNLNGDESSFIFVPHLPISKHVELLQQMKETKKKESDAAS